MTIRTGKAAAVAALCLLLQAQAAWAAPAPEPKTSMLTWNEFEKIPLPAPGSKIAYGEAPQQFGELRLPQGRGPFPVVVLLHGGCWLAEFDHAYVTRLAAALAGEGYAVWTVEYRRLGHPGGGWPNTLLDPARATDHLRLLAQSHPLDLGRVVAVGHSSGGQLALWLGARGKLTPGSELYLPNPLPLKAVIGLAAITDLHTYRIGPPDSCNASVDQFMGGSDTRHPQRYAQASPMALLPLGVPQWLIHGELDRIVPVTSVGAYAQAATAKGDLVNLTILPRSGHFEPVAPQPPAWAALLDALKAALRPRAEPAAARAPAALSAWA